MSIEIKKSIKPVNYLDAISFLEKRVEKIINKQEKELILQKHQEEERSHGTVQDN